MLIPDSMLKQLYTLGSLRKTDKGLSFSLKNRIKSAHFNQILHLFINNQKIDMSKIMVALNSDTPIGLHTLEQKKGIDFPLGATLTVFVDGTSIPDSKIVDINITITAPPFGDIKLVLKDKLPLINETLNQIPRNAENDFHPDIIKKRQEYVSGITDTTPQNLFNFDADLASLSGNIEHFCGMAQIPIGIAGPIKVNGEHAQGEFLIPLATTEGTLVASYNRGIKLLNQSGGVKATVVDDAMQRAPVFVFDDAREARDFDRWVTDNIDGIRQQAEATDPHVKLRNIESYKANKFAFLRFNFTTGDAGGQNMVGRATYFACGWIIEQYPGIKNFFLESNMATDKKSSFINILHTRGKRVTAEVTIKKSDLIEVMRVEPTQIGQHQRAASIGAFLAGANNTGLHSANGITAMFIATGQDVANVSESSAGIIYSEINDEGDLYLSITLPSLIIATCGGGTGLGTQKECLEMLHCYGPGKALKFAEIVASVVLAGEISLASAISSLDWVTSHEELGRN
ncbi:hydroxymethylglutaryl-coenzyme A reductase [Glaciecola nitratireducens FR1064]|uniref:hydroxymethylglutaryl-CoA reductase (NADPH) n=1 Tax=Glaciecola nitratireducens (strain JCM 12485 / KCTC 12276 / FR1064) TaxID=1085623 RepID=G4QL28_GLANF|nr:hydroxymethylglutaryl-coenzyme A reductase [Glaciecola nitratireducens FR1064]